MKMDLQGMNKDMLIKLIQTCRQDLEEELKGKDILIEKCVASGAIAPCKECQELCVKSGDSCCNCMSLVCKKHSFTFIRQNGQEIFMCKECNDINGNSYMNSFGWIRKCDFVPKSQK